MGTLFSLGRGYHGPCLPGQEDGGPQLVRALPGAVGRALWHLLSLAG